MGTRPTSAAPESLAPSDLSHDALALEMGRRGWNKDARYVAASGQWFFWNDVSWARDETREAMTRTRTYLRERSWELRAWAVRKAEELKTENSKKLPDWAEREARRLGDKQTVAAVESLAQSNPESRAGIEDFDADLMLLGTPGGTVDLRSGELRPARRKDMITRLTKVAPLSGRPRRWLTFLEEVFDGD